MIFNVVFLLFGIYSVVYTLSFVVYEYRQKNLLSVFVNLILAVIAVFIFCRGFV